MEDKYKFSVAMSVYKNDVPSQLREALKSICEQSLKADEIYLVIDGPIGDELKNIIEEFSNKYGNFTINQLEKNGGLGNALKIALENCKYDLVMRMDSDDISAPGRFKKMIESYKEDPVDVLGSWTIGFVGDSPFNGDISIAERKIHDNDIKKQLPKKSPMSHVTVLMNKQSVIDSGNYIELYYHEDYYLWARMIARGCVFRNIPEYLVYVRLGVNQAKRHGGIRYFKAEQFLRRYLFHNKLSPLYSYVKETLIRFIYQLCITPSLRNKITTKYKRRYISREKADEILNKNCEWDKTNG